MQIAGEVRKLGRSDEAEAVYTTAMQLDPTSFVARFRLIETMVPAQRHEEAAPIVEQTQSLGPRAWRVAIQAARYKRWLGRPDEAIQILQSHLGIQEDADIRAQLQAEIANLYLHLNDYQTASEMLNATDDSEQNFRLTLARVRLALAQGRYEDVETLGHEWRRTGAEGIRFLAPYEMAIGHDDHARELFEEIPSELGLMPAAAVSMAHLYLKVDDADTAAALLEKSRQAFTLQLEDKYTAGGAYYSLASISAIEGETDEALNLLEKAIASGWTGHSFAPRNPNLESLWEEPRFQALITGVKAEMDRLRLAM